MLVPAASIWYEIPFSALQFAGATGEAGSCGPWLVELVEVTVEVEVDVFVDVDDETVVDEEVKVVDELQVTIASPPSPLPWQPLPNEIGSEALEVLKPIASEVTKNTNTNPTRTRVPLLVLSLLAPVIVDPVNIVYRYGSRIYIIILSDCKLTKTPKQSIHLIENA